MSEAPIRLTNPLTGPSPEFWEGEHVAFNEHGKIHNISGYGFNAYSDILKVAELVASATVVLDIGVGTCQAIKDLVAMGKSVCALDCCPTALARAVKAGASPFMRPEGLPGDHFDLITCHLVAQHLTDEILQNIMVHAIRALKPGGTFAIQSADVPGRARQGYEFVAAGNILRDVEEMTSMLRKAGATSVKMVQVLSVVPSQNVVWHGFHARRSV